MKLIKKISSLMLVLCIAFSTLSGCAGTTTAPSESKTDSSVPPVSSTAEKTTIKIGTFKGPTGLGMLKIMNDSESKTSAENYEFSVVSSPDQMVSKIIKGEVDVAAVPTNLASVLYNKTKKKVQIAAINTLGVLSILTNGEKISNIKDLKGKTVYSSGQGATPEYALNYILKQNGLQVNKDVKVEYKANHPELASQIISGNAKIAVLPEPFITQVMTKNKDVKIALNLTEEWNKAAGGKSALSMGCLIVRKDFVDKNKDAFNTFLDEYKKSTEYTNSNIDNAAKLSEKFEIMPAAVTKKAIPNCNIVYIDGKEMKSKIPDFLNILFTANKKSVGGNLPGDDFYYTK